MRDGSSMPRMRETQRSIFGSRRGIEAVAMEPGLCHRAREDHLRAVQQGVSGRLLPPKLGEHELAVALEPGQQQKGSEEELAVDAVWTPCSLIVTAAIFRASTHQGERADRASVSARRVAQPISFDTGKKKVPCTSNEDPSIARQDYIVGSSSKDLGGDDSEPTRVRDSACEMMANSNATSELDCSRSRRRRRCAAAAPPVLAHCPSLHVALSCADAVHIKYFLAQQQASRDLLDASEKQLCGYAQ